MKTKIFTKKLLVTLSIVLIAVMALVIAGCTNNNSSETPTTEGTTKNTTQSSVTTKGEGETAFAFYVVDESGKETHFMIKTDKETVGEALVELGLIAGDESQYGLYVKTVNGITLDYDKDKMYWAFYEENTYANQGVDKTVISEGTVYSFRAEK